MSAYRLSKLLFISCLLLAVPNILTAQCTGLTVGSPSVSNVACFGDNNGIINMSIQVDSQVCTSPIVALNEIMYRPTLSNGVDPNTGEYIELIAPPGTNIGCYVLTDGDWVLVIPPNTIVPADGIFTIGNNIVYGANTFDLDAENCNCFSEGTAGGALLILTDGGEYVALFNGSGTFVQGLIYGSPTGGNRPTGGTVLNLPSVTGCGLTNVTLPAATSFETTAGGVNNGTSLIRSPDGTGGWTTQTGGSVNACNAAAINGYDVLWSNGSTTNSISGLAAGVYTVTVTHSSGCTVTQSATVTSPSLLVANIDSTRQSACLLNNGAAFATASGGTGAYSYLWSNGATSQNLTNVGSGSYNLSVTDVRGCRTVVSATVPNASGLQASATAANPACFGDSNGSINIVITGGTINPTFQWSNGATTQNLANLANGTYSLTITETNGCVSTLQTQIAEPSALQLSLNTQTNVNCAGESNGGISTQTVGGTAPYSYAWSASGVTTGNINNLSAGVYTLTVSDDNGCSDVFTTTVTEPAPLSLNLDVANDRLACDLLPTGAINAIVQGGTAPVAFVWNDGGSETLRDDLTAGNYSLTITDNNGCTATAAATITAPIVPSINAIFDTTNTNTHTALTGTPIRIRATNTPQTNIGYLWAVISSNAAGITFEGNTSADTRITPNTSGVYVLEVTATSIDGCVFVDTITLEAYDNFLGVPTAFTPNNDGENDLFRPLSLNAQYIKSFQIYNRWGQLLYDDTTLSGGGWDGTINGAAQARDVYVYILTYQLPQAEEQQMRGTFMLVR
jgi:gliding motility-associated-like protein